MEMAKDDECCDLLIKKAIVAFMTTKVITYSYLYTSPHDIFIMGSCSEVDIFKYCTDMFQICVPAKNYSRLQNLIMSN